MYLFGLDIWFFLPETTLEYKIENSFQQLKFMLALKEKAWKVYGENDRGSQEVNEQPLQVFMFSKTIITQMG